jgi:molecular chaperone DnaK (HSP70)
MAKKVLGIDLGTVHSCVAVPGDEIEGEDVTIIKDHLGRATIPSIVWKSPGGEFVVGYRAKQKVGTHPTPISFIKRYMGKDYKVKVTDEMMSPEQVSAKILEYLAVLAKNQLKEDIHQAVITIPARFDLQGQQATVEAARLAGLEVLTTMPEPVAAALAYGLQDEADNIKIFCYDLGGGTFDATVMKKDIEKGIDVLVFDGDPQLGGYNFDKEFAKWLLEGLQSKYSLKLDFNKPEDMLIFEKLMYVAEKAKQQLSKELEVSIHEEELFSDHDGELVTIDMTVTRPQFEGMIRPLVEESLQISGRAIGKAKLEPKDIDRVIMVGGSSRIPMIKQLLEERLGCKAELVDPDMIIARGAAIKAGSLVGSSVEGISFLTELPKTCPLDNFDIHGQITLPDPVGLNVHIERADGNFENDTQTDAEGKFSFDQVELVENVSSDFEITVGSPGKPIATHSFTVEQKPDIIGPPSQTSSLTKNISLMLVTGLHHVFKEGSYIPANTSETLRTVNDNETFLVFDVYNGNQRIGEVRIDDIPPGLPAGSELKVDISLSDDFILSGNATLMKNQQSVSFLFRIPKPPIPEPAAMIEHFETLKEEFETALEIVSDDIEKMKASNDGNKYIRDITKELKNEPIDKMKILRLLDELKTLIVLLSRVEIMDPAWSKFEEKVTEAREQSRDAEKKSEKAKKSDFKTTIDTIERMGELAYDQKNKDAWRNANQQIQTCLGQIYSTIYEKEIQNLTPEERAGMFKDYVLQLIEKVFARVNTGKRGSRAKDYERFETELMDLARRLNNVDTSRPQEAFSTLADIRTKTERLDRMIENIGGVAI